MQPSVPGNQLRSFLRIVPIAEHHIITPDKKLPRAARWQNFTALIDNFDLSMS